MDEKRHMDEKRNRMRVEKAFWKDMARNNKYCDGKKDREKTPYEEFHNMDMCVLG